MNKKTILIIVLVSVAVMAVFGVISCALTGSYMRQHDVFDFKYPKEIVSFSDSGKIDMTGIDKVEITVVSTDVLIGNSRSDLTADLQVGGRLPHMGLSLVTETVGSTAHVRVIYPNTAMSIQISKLTVGLPEDFSGEVVVNTVSGDVSATSITNRISGFTLNAISGDLTLLVPAVDTLICKSASGDMEVNTEINNLLSVNTASGDLEIGSIAKDSAKVDIRSISGDVDIAYDSACPTEIRTTSGDIRVAMASDDPIRLNFSSTSGDYRGRVNTGAEGVDFKIASVSGDLSFE